MVIRRSLSRQKHGSVIEKIKQQTNQGKVEENGEEKNERKPVEETSQEDIKVR